MPIASATPPATPEPVKPSVIEKAEYQGITNDSKYTPVSTLLPYIEGQALVGDYYSGVMSSDMSVTPQQTGRPAAYQSYHRIIDCELKLSSAFSQSQDEAKQFSVTGNALVYPFIIPNIGDMYVVDIGDGRDGIFTITNSERKTIMRDACYEITLTLVAYLDDVRKADLLAKTIKTSHFVKDFLTRGQNPVVVASDAELLVELQHLGKYILNSYLMTFYSPEFKALLVPGQDEPVYDHFLMKFFKQTFNADVHPLLRKLNYYNVEGSASFTNETIWDALLACDANVLYTSTKQMAVCDAIQFRGNPIYNHIYYSGIRHLMSPVGDLDGVDRAYSPDYNIPQTNLTLSVYSTDELARLHRNPYVDGGIEWLVKPVDNASYVVSASFYGTVITPSSLLEVMLKNALEGKPIDTVNLKAVSDSYKHWKPLEQYYYGPLLLTLIRLRIGGI